MHKYTNQFEYSLNIGISLEESKETFHTDTVLFSWQNGGHSFIGLLVKKVGQHKQDTIIIL